jgi:hypothetical protein
LFSIFSIIAFSYIILNGKKNLTFLMSKNLGIQKKNNFAISFIGNISHLHADISTMLTEKDPDKLEKMINEYNLSSAEFSK